MTEGKVAAQVAHAVIGLGVTDPLCTIIVLRVSDKKFTEMSLEKDCFIHSDYGVTEVSKNELTAAAWYEEG